MKLLMLTESRTVHARRWAHAMIEHGWDVSMLSVDPQPIDGVEIHPLRAPHFGIDYPMRWWGRYRKYVRDVVQRVDPDLMHIHYLTDYPLQRETKTADAPWSADPPQPPLIISTWGADVVHDPYVQADASDQRERKVQLLHTADAVTATTNFLADQTAHYAGIDRDAIDVIPFGVDIDRYTARIDYGLRRTPVIGLVKHLEPKYGVDVLIRALPLVHARFPDVRCLIYGDGSLRESLQRLADDAGVGPHIGWRGRVDHADVPRVLSDMDVFVMPSVSTSETFGVAAVEAQAAGVPVVFSDLPGVREAVQHDVGGLAVTPGDPACLADAIITLLEQQPLRRRLGQTGRRMAMEQFDFQENVAAMQGVYERTLEQCTVMA